MNAQRAAVGLSMWIGVLGAFEVALLGGVLAAQTPTADKDKKKPEVITLSGCVSRAERSPSQFTLEDTKTGVKYRLTGTNVRDFVGRPVLIIGSGPKKLAIVGGLTPNPNVAAQAGAMDPARAAVASQGGSAGPGNVDLPEFNVKSVRPGSGSCPDMPRR
jgi:hypothetical protein